jgi:hypothetical protein
MKNTRQTALKLFNLFAQDWEDRNNLLPPLCRKWWNNKKYEPREEPITPKRKTTAEVQEQQKHRKTLRTEAFTMQQRLQNSASLLTQAWQNLCPQKPNDTPTQTTYIPTPTTSKLTPMEHAAQLLSEACQKMNTPRPRNKHRAERYEGRWKISDIDESAEEEKSQTPPPPRNNRTKRKQIQTPITHKTPKAKQNRQKHEQPTNRKPGTSKAKPTNTPNRETQT